MWDTFFPWAVGVIVFTVTFYGAAVLVAPLFDLETPRWLRWAKVPTELTFTIVNVTMVASIAAVVAVGVVYGCYRLGRLVLTYCA